MPSPECAWCGGECLDPKRNRRGEVFCSGTHRRASNRALKNLLDREVATELEPSRRTMPHDNAPLWVWHAWLCHGADPDGAQGEPCPDGCDGSTVDHDRHRQYLASWSANPRRAVAAELEKTPD